MCFFALCDPRTPKYGSIEFLHMMHNILCGDLVGKNSLEITLFEMFSVSEKSAI